MLITLKRLLETIEQNKIAQEVAFNTLKALNLIPQEAELCLNNLDDEVNFDTFFETFVKLWDNLPPSISNGKGNKENARNKLQLYIHKTGHTQKQILDATKQYLENCILRNIKARFPQYFIISQYKTMKDVATDSDLYNNVINPNENVGDIYTVHV